MSEKEVFEQELSADELENAAGGGGSLDRLACSPKAKDKTTGCYNYHYRDIYEGGFPNCAATVEDGSFCDTNDACFHSQVSYQNKKSCFMVWQ